MPWLFGVIWLPLLLCFLLGALLATVWWTWRGRSINAEYEKRRLTAEAESDRLRLRVSALRKSEARADDLQLELENARVAAESVPRLEHQIKELRVQVEMVSELENQISNLRARADQADRLEALTAEFERELAARDAALAEIEAAAEPEPEPETEFAAEADPETEFAAEADPETEAEPVGNGMLAVPSAAHQDDLKIIKGIGPKMEEKLNELGIQTWEQLAALPEPDVTALGLAIAVFPGRIERDRWVEQAAEFVQRFPLRQPYDRPTRETLGDRP